MYFLVNTFKALSDETRLRILKLLEVEELCVYEMVQALDMGQSRISRHLRILHDAGFVLNRQDGPRICYSLDRQKLDGYAGPILHLLEDWEKDNPIVRTDRERLETVVRGPRCAS